MDIFFSGTDRISNEEIGDRVGHDGSSIETADEVDGLILGVSLTGVDF